MKVYVEHVQTMWSNNWRILVALGPWVWKMTLSVQISWKIPCSLHVFSCNVCAENNDLHHANHAIPVACLLNLQSKRDEFSDRVQQLKNSFRRSPGSTWALSFFRQGASSQEYSRNSETYLRKNIGKPYGKISGKTEIGAGSCHGPVKVKNTWLDLSGNKQSHTGWGPPVISWFINHYKPH